MRVVYSPAAVDRGVALVRVVGACRACKKQNVVWLVKGHIITMATLSCEFCGSHDGEKKKKTSEAGIEWYPGTSCWDGRIMGANYPEMAKAGDLVT
jgi:hypothetical protein